MTPTQDASTRAVARLPGLDVTVEHFESRGEGPEELRVTLRLPQGSDGFTPVLGFVNPMLTGLVMAQAFWGPWLNLMGAMPWMAMLPGARRPPGT